MLWDRSVLLFLYLRNAFDTTNWVFVFPAQKQEQKLISEFLCHISLVYSRIEGEEEGNVVNLCM
jgi:hypothetical protein